MGRRGSNGKFVFRLKGESPAIGELNGSQRISSNSTRLMSSSKLILKSAWAPPI